VGDGHVDTIVRRPRRPSTAQPSAAVEGKSARALHVDTTGDGLADSIAIDTVGDGVVDTLVKRPDTDKYDGEHLRAQHVDTTGDGFADINAIDTMGDGMVDTLVKRPATDGYDVGQHVRALHVDTTGDGVADSVAIDTTRDGRVDTILPSPAKPKAARALLPQSSVQLPPNPFDPTLRRGSEGTACRANSVERHNSADGVNASRSSTTWSRTRSASLSPRSPHSLWRRSRAVRSSTCT